MSGSALLSQIANLDGEQFITVRVREIREMATAPAPEIAVDLPAKRVAELIGRDPVTVAAWCRAGIFRNAYRLNRREWRIPAESFAAYQQQQRAAA